MKLKMGNAELSMGSKYVTELRSSNDILHDEAALRKRLDEDGYLLIRGFHDTEKVKKARYGMLVKLQKMGRIDPSYQLEEGIVNTGAKGTMFGGPANDDPDMQHFYTLVNAPNVMQFLGRNHDVRFQIAPGGGTE
jgi:hypothetical protein